MRVQVYRNLHRKCWSVRSKATGRVIAHKDALTLGDVTFKVSEAGRQRVLRDKRKNVHAVVEGTWTAHVGDLKTHGMRRVAYNPYQAPTFVDKDSGAAVTKANRVCLTPQGCFVED